MKRKKTNPRRVPVSAAEAEARAMRRAVLNTSTLFLKELYCQRQGVIHSDLYEKHGFLRTGCACCPFGSWFEQELQDADELDPGLAKAVRNIFRTAHEYTRAYRQFKAQHDAAKKND